MAQRDEPRIKSGVTRGVGNGSPTPHFLLGLDPSIHAMLAKTKTGRVYVEDLLAEHTLTILDHDLMDPRVKPEGEGGIGKLNLYLCMIRQMAKRKKQIGKCLLLGTEGAFARSHIIPRFVGDKTLGQAHRIEMGEHGARPKLVFNSWTDSKLCGQKGEERLRDIDTAASKVFQKHGLS